jgi:methionine-rich copper-binding protein CopC
MFSHGEIMFSVVAHCHVADGEIMFSVVAHGHVVDGEIMFSDKNVKKYLSC